MVSIEYHRRLKRLEKNEYFQLVDSLCIHFAVQNMGKLWGFRLTRQDRRPRESVGANLSSYSFDNTESVVNIYDNWFPDSPSTLAK